MNWNVQWYASGGRILESSLELDVTASSYSKPALVLKSKCGFYGAIPIERMVKIESGYGKIKDRAEHDVSNQDAATFFSILPENESDKDTLYFKATSKAERDEMTKVLGDEIQKQGAVYLERMMAEREEEIERLRTESEQQILERRASIDRARAAADEFENECKRKMESQMEEEQQHRIELEQKQRELEEVQRQIADQQQQIEDEQRQKEIDDKSSAIEQTQKECQRVDEECTKMMHQETAHEELEMLTAELERAMKEQEEEFAQHGEEMDKKLAAAEQRRLEMEMQTLEREREFSENIDRMRREQQEAEREGREELERWRKEVDHELDILEQEAQERRGRETEMEMEMDRETARKEKEIIRQREREIEDRFEMEMDKIMSERKSLTQQEFEDGKRRRERKADFLRKMREAERARIQADLAENERMMEETKTDVALTIGQSDEILALIAEIEAAHVRVENKTDELLMGLRDRR